MERLQIKEDYLKVSILSLKSSFSYAAKLLNLILQDTTEASPPPPEAFELANDMLDLITAIEIYLGSSFAAQLTAVAKSWLPDLILALGSGTILKQTPIESTYMRALSQVKLHCPSWPSILAKTELFEISKVNPDEDDHKISEPEEFPVFKKFIDKLRSGEITRNLIY